MRVQPNIDVSSLLNDYQLVQNPDQPSILVKRSTTVGLQPEKILYTHKPLDFHHLRSSYEMTMLAARFAELWALAANQMIELLKESAGAPLNPHSGVTSKRAALTAFLWLFKLFRADETLPCPDIVPNGEGGVDIEWTLEGVFVSVQIHQTDPRNDRIYFKKDVQFNSKDLNLENLINLIRG